ncbi:MAG: exonuclease domain-containing protein [Candidatus Cyclobacteriaceae bacterium M2_1C_046]
MYAIVDIETTGGFAKRHKITEVAIYIHDGTQVVESFSSLVNPSHFLPGYITGLTGITPGMLTDAPPFKQIAPKVAELLKDKIFVAHNVHFDFSFIKKELQDSGYAFNAKKLCTVRLTRKLVPGLRSYSLGNIAAHFKVPVHDRHRAGGDAKATAIIFDKLLRMDRNGVIGQLLKTTNKEMRLPSMISEVQFEALPEKPGVYYFLNNKQEVIYVGKAKDIKKRISGHFSGKGGSWSNQNIRNQICEIKYELTGNEFIALIHESLEIKRLWPKYNSSQKNDRLLWGLFHFEDQNNYIRLAVNRQMPGMQPVKTFRSHSEAWHFLQEKVKEFELCSRLSGLHKVPAACYDHALGTCKGACIKEEEAKEYNKRIQKLFEEIGSKDDIGSCAIVGKGRKSGERSLVLIENGAYIGHGFFNRNQNFNSLLDARELITPYSETPEIRQYLVSALASASSDQVLSFN